MLIGVDASRALSEESTGTEYYNLKLLESLGKIDKKNHYVIYLNKLPKNLPFSFRSFSTRVLRLPRLWTQVGLAYETLINPPDILFIPAHTIPVVRNPKIKTIVTIHDLGSNYLAAYHQFPHKIYLNWSTLISVKFATHLIAVSQSTKKDIINQFGAKQDKISVIYEGVDLSRFKPENSKLKITRVLKKYKIQNPYILFVGTIQPRKNLVRLIQAFSQLIEIYKEPINLVIAGKPGWLYEEIYRVAKEPQVANKVKFLNYISEEDLPPLYSGASLFAFPSLYEGFGLPVLEAMACGTAVLTSKVSSLPEVGGKAAFFVDPYNLDEIKKGMYQIITDNNLRKTLISKGVEQVRKFSWEKAAKETLKVFEKVYKD